MPYYPQPVTVKDAGMPVGTQPAINFIEGANVTLTITDDPGNNEVDVTIAASGGSATPGTPANSIQFNSDPAGTFTGSSDFIWDGFGLMIGTTTYIATSGQFEALKPGDTYYLAGSNGGVAQSGTSFEIRSGRGDEGNQGNYAVLRVNGSNDSGIGGSLSFLAGFGVAGNGGASFSGYGGNDDGEGGGIEFSAGDGIENNSGSIEFSTQSPSASTDPFNAGDIRLSPASSGVNGGRGGLIFLNNLPSADPGEPGALYQVAGALMISL